MPAKKSKAVKPQTQDKPRRAKRSRTVAERSGLTQRDALLSGAQDTPHPTSAIDQQFAFWMTMIRASPWPSVLHQQIRLARAVMEFCLPTKSERN